MKYKSDARGGGRNDDPNGPNSATLSLYETVEEAHGQAASGLDA